jgi:hypothetical protein
MIGSTWNALFITTAMAAGMFAQQAAHKVSAGSEDRQVNSLSGLESYCSAEGYYLAGFFQGSAATPALSLAVVTLPQEDEPPVVAATEAWPEMPAEPLAAEPEPVDPALEPAIAAPLLVASNPWAESSEAETTEPLVETAMVADPLPQAEESAVAQSEPEFPALADGEPAESVSPPAPNLPLTSPRHPAERLVAEPPPVKTPRPPRPSTIAAAGESTYDDQASQTCGRYVSPADLVRERQIARGEQLRQRVEMRKALGISPLRPAINATPYSVAEPPQLFLVVPSTAPRWTH